MTNYRQQAREIYANSNIDQWSLEVEKIVNGALEDDKLNFARVPIVPTAEMLKALYGPYLSPSAQETRMRAWLEMLAVAAKQREALD
jgi:hypothetical protein